MKADKSKECKNPDLWGNFPGPLRFLICIKQKYHAEFFSKQNSFPAKLSQWIDFLPVWHLHWYDETAGLD